MAEELSAKLEKAGAKCVRAGRREALKVLSEKAPLAGVVCLFGGSPKGEGSPAEEAEGNAVWGMGVAKALVGREEKPGLWWVTEGAQAVRRGGSGEEVAVEQSSVWGLGRVVRQEYPELGCRLVDIQAGDVEALWEELRGGDEEPEVAWRGKVRQVARLARAAAETISEKAAIEGTVLITGGLGTLGLHVARWLVEERGAKELVLLGRQAPTGQKLEAVEGLKKLGAASEGGAGGCGG